MNKLFFFNIYINILAIEYLRNGENFISMIFSTGDVISVNKCMHI